MSLLNVGGVSALEMFTASLGKDVPPPKEGKTVVRASTDDETRLVLPEIVDGLLQPDGTPWPGAQSFVVTKDHPRWFGEIGSTFVGRQFVPVTPELAKRILDRFGKGNRSQQKTTLDKYTESQMEGKSHSDSGWSFVFNQFLFTVGKAGSLILSEDSQHNGGHTATAMLKSGATILANFGFGIPKKHTGRIDDCRKRDQKSTIETMKPFLNRIGQNGKISGIVIPSVKHTAATVKSMTAILTTSLSMVVRVRNGEQPKSGGSGMDNEETFDAAEQYMAVLERCTEDVFLLFGKDKTFALHHLVAAMVLACSDVAEDGSIVLNEGAAKVIINLYAVGVNEAFKDESLPMVALRNKFRSWSNGPQKINTNGSGMNIRWCCLKLALIKSANGESVPSSSFDKLKATDHNDKGLRLGGIDDYVSAVDAAMESKPAAANSAVPADLYPVAEEKIDG